MNKTLISALLAGAALVPFAASAQTAPATTADGTITFNGNVQSTTCIISVNDGNKDGAVNLPTAKTTDLAADGAKFGATPFSIKLTGCVAAGGATLASTVKPYFVGSAVNTAGRLNNTLADGAQRVNLELLNASNDSVINLAAARGSQGADQAAINNGAATLNYKARYYATGAATAGLVRSNVQFYLDMQ
ncbi:fimbrial protein [Herbaspirillum autotrophicum]|uniref:fimbrial protein n=1 Tax=Herbaspirillum autotrophicum TaxID=180195 RepID=UPI00067AD169|nr:fimbrial protein [Herbaspirillum autotrophicum]